MQSAEHFCHKLHLTPLSMSSVFVDFVRKVLIQFFITGVTVSGTKKKKEKKNSFISFQIKMTKQWSYFPNVKDSEK